MDDCQPVALRASARYVSIAAVDSRLVSSSVERRRLNGASLLHQIIGRRKLLAFDHFIQSSHINGRYQSVMAAPGTFSPSAAFVGYGKYRGVSRCPRHWGAPAEIDPGCAKTPTLFCKYKFCLTFGDIKRREILLTFTVTVMMNKKILTTSRQSAFLDGQDPLRKWQPTRQKDLAEDRSR